MHVGMDTFREGYRLVGVVWKACAGKIRRGNRSALDACVNVTYVHSTSNYRLLILSLLSSPSLPRGYFFRAENIRNSRSKILCLNMVSYKSEGNYIPAREECEHAEGSGGLGSLAPRG